MQEEGLFNNKIKQRRTKTTPEGEKQTVGLLTSQCYDAIFDSVALVS